MEQLRILSDCSLGTRQDFVVRLEQFRVKAADQLHVFELRIWEYVIGDVLHHIWGEYHPFTFIAAFEK